MAKIIFMGTPDFAVPALKSLHEAGHDIQLVVSQPDKKKGRGQKFQETPTKKYALSIDCEVYQPASLKDGDAADKLASYNADFFVVIAYGKILPSSILQIPKKGCINVHASLLPKWRGAAPIQFAIWKDDRESGVCTMLMDKGMDTGDLLLIEVTQIEKEEKVNELSDRLSQMGSLLIAKTIATFDDITPRPQNHELATYARMITKEDRMIEWDQSARDIFCQFRALSPQPGMFTFFRDKRLMVKEISQVEGTDSQNGVKAGTLTSITQSGLQVACTSGAITILTCQPENKKPMIARDFANGYQLKTGDTFGT